MKVTYKYVRTIEVELELPNGSNPSDAILRATTIVIDNNGDDRCSSSLEFIGFDIAKQPLKTISEFVKACCDAGDDEIYELFENGCTAELRQELYAIAAAIDKCSPEPVRLAIMTLGNVFNVRSMKYY